VLVDVRDSVYILDGIGRITVLSPSFEVVRTMSIAGQRPWAYDAMLLPGHGFVFDYQRDSSPPLHAYSFDGQRLVQFGYPQLNTRGFVRDVYKITTASDGSMWALQAHHGYLGTRWDATGTLLDSGMVNSPWFAPYDSIMSPTPDRVPQAQVWSIWQDSIGLLWVLGATGDPDWSNGLGEERTGEGGARYYPVEDMAAVFDGIIEVIDPATWSVVATRRLANNPFLQAIRPGVVASLREASEGWWQAEVYRVELTGVPH
jgi:hypothetical protein